MYISAIVLAAGKGLRLNSDVPKPLLRINSQPLIIYSLKTLSQNRLIKEIIIAADPLNIKAMAEQMKRYGISKVKNIILGGKRRQDSVYNGLSAINPAADLVLIHDAARPFIEKQKVSRVINQAAKYGASILAVPVKATIKRIREQRNSVGIPTMSGSSEGYTVTETLNRDNLWEVQTPQVFKKVLILRAYKKFGNLDATDDASLVEKLGARVNVILGSYNNIKITTEEDLILAEAIARRGEVPSPG